ncbi:MAG TPA: toll/interleukin-1 receptor domain-containing protein [Thermoanaerobaculia bacterium]|nr:toll/interleukin-1 receptor domain-containing protein [Thermoanaerobaculia bacterium]
MGRKRTAAPREVFLSHSHWDHPFTQKLAKTLREHGIACWYAEKDIRGAEQWHREIGDALQRCDWFLVVLTPEAVDSTWVERELIYALRKERYNGRVIPLLRKDCDYENLSWTLPALQIIDVRKKYGDALRELLRIWGIGYRG